MPQKYNRAGQLQNYVPAGNGDASGEYGDNASGSNKHFTSFKKPDGEQERVYVDNNKPKSLQTQTKKQYFQYNEFYNTWYPMSQRDYERYQEGINKGYWWEETKKVEEREIQVVNDEELDKIKKDLISKIEKDIESANIDEIGKYVRTAYDVISNEVSNLLENELSSDSIQYLKYSDEYKQKIKNGEVEKEITKLAEQKAIKLANDYIRDNFTKIKGEHTIQDDLKNTNPDYKTNSYYRINCQRCSFVYELRRRGYDIVANPNEDDYGSGSRWEAQMVFKEQHMFVNRNGKIKKKIIEKVKEAGEGSRFAVDVTWKGARNGHLFIAENVGGEVKFYDAQMGREDCEYYFDNISPSSFTRILRMDNADFSYGVKKTGHS